MTTESTAPDVPVDPDLIRQQIQALVLTHTERKRHDREYLGTLIADARKILVDHAYTAETGACAECSAPWPCGMIKMIRSEQFYID